MIERTWLHFLLVCLVLRKNGVLMKVGSLTVLTIVREAGREAAGLGLIWPLERIGCYESGDSACQDSQNVTFDTFFQSNHLLDCKGLCGLRPGVTDQNQVFRNRCRWLSFNRTGNQKLLLKDFVQIYNRVSSLIQRNAQSMGRLMCALMFQYYESLMMNSHDSRACKSDDCIDSQEINIHLFYEIYSFKNRFSLSACILALIKSSGFYKFLSPSLLKSSKFLQDYD